MTTATTELPQPLSDLTAPAAMPGPIIVASDGGAPAATALAVARMLRDQTGAVIRVISVVEPTAAIVPAPMLLAEPVGESRVQQRHATVREQVDRIVGTTPPVDVQIEVGWTPEVLARLVREADASFFVAGLVHHGAVERLARTETPLSVLRGADAPVLALPWGRVREPHCVVIGVDLTDSSVTAAVHAAPLLRDVEKVYLLHVQEPVPPLSEIPLPADYDEEVVEEAFRRVQRALTLPPGATVESRVLVGHPAFELADFADYVQADLLVLGHHHRGLWGRMLHSSVSERTYRAANCGVLIVPDDTRDPVGHHAAPDIVDVAMPDRADWVSELRAFTIRNAGRRVNLEVLTPDLGAQSASVNFPLFGVDYDPALRTVDVMLGDDQRRMRHVTHTLHGVSGIALSRRAGGADWALRVRHDAGELILTFVQ